VVNPAENHSKRSVDSLLDEARADIDRYTVAEAFDYQQQGALLIDIRPVAQRAEHGVVPDALIIERNVLEWRLDPQCDHRLPGIGSYERRIMILCQQGYASSFAAASVRALGYLHVADVIGGFDAWRAAGLPVQANV
jgi:rhodanese-related sulfurtransferase